MTFKLVEQNSQARIKVIGVGGGGGNAVNTMVESTLLGVEFIAANTDMQALSSSKADIRLQLGPSVTKGLGAGANPERGRESAEESMQDIKEALKDSDMIFITAGLGGGTGTGAAPVVAKISKELGALTVGVVTKPFVFEGRTRMRNAEKGWEALREHVDTIITIPNDRLIAMSQKGTKFIEGMKMADDVLVQAVKGITDLINKPGYINPDFADLRAIMNETGPALMGAGHGVGDNRAVEAVNMAIASPLLQDISIDGARGVLVNISARQDSLSMAEVTEATTRIYEEVHDDANIIFGVIFDDTLGDAMRVTVIATGINSREMERLPENVKPLLQKKEKTAQQLPFDEDEQLRSRKEHGWRCSGVTTANRSPSTYSTRMNWTAPPLSAATKADGV
ncbi:MAG: cell division protein FtsZ [Deltaproteobacteria bacterium]